MVGVSPCFLSILPVEVAPGFTGLSTGQRQQGSEGRRDQQGASICCGRDLVAYSLSTEYLGLFRSLTLIVTFTSLAAICKSYLFLAQEWAWDPLKGEHTAMATSS